MSFYGLRNGVKPGMQWTVYDYAMLGVFVGLAWAGIFAVVAMIRG